ncbi:Aldo/keto reductase [Tothia fuscella]|uniref:Aldo/keto reductase n=1 Tax=Tothia fuscella TaxID=1048955 RepID=A0A9P4U0J8_9PEZI|nr:Aldo/keto reductase [Tothia fuscella]
MTTLVNKKIGSTGFGLMGLTWRATPIPIEEAIKVMKSALEKGANFWNGGVLYGTPEYNSLHLLKAYFTKYPEDASKVVISIKGGINPASHGPDGSKDFITKEVEDSIAVLDGKCRIDIYECARVDPKTPIEETVGALAELVKAGKIGGIGLSEIGEKSIRKATAVAKIASVEVEFSMFSTDLIENGVAAACAEFSIPIVAYSPLSRGLLTGEIRKFEDLPKDDMRRNFPRFQPENFEKNMDLVHAVEKLASEKGCTSGNIAIAWVKAQSGRQGRPVIIPIPGTVTEKRLAENMTDVRLSEDDLDILDKALKECGVHGDRYGGPLAALQWG